MTTRSGAEASQKPREWANLEAKPPAQLNVQVIAAQAITQLPPKQSDT